MEVETDGIVIKQVKALNSVRMIKIFTEDYGKISAGTLVTEKSKSKSALAMKPFTLSRFELKENKGYINIKNAETVKSYFKISEDIDKFANGSYALEFTEKLRPEEASLEHKTSRLFPLLIEYLDILEERKKAYDTLTLAFLIKSMQISGIAPGLKECLICGEKKTPAFFNIADAGYICEGCSPKEDDNGYNSLLYKINFDIVGVLNFLMENPLGRVKQLELEHEIAEKLWKIIKEYISYHLDIGNLKSENLLNFNESIHY